MSKPKTKEQIKEYFKENSIQKIVEECTKSELTQMFETVFNGLKPLTKNTKKETANQIHFYFITQRRAEAFGPQK